MSVGLRCVWRELPALGLLVALALLLLGREILFGGTLFDYDILLMSIPVYSWFSEGLRQGQFPIWSADVMGGFPLAFAIYGFFYPLDILLFRLLDAARAFHLTLALHLALAGCCTYWYCRVVGMRRVPSLLAAVAFQMGNEVLAWQSNGFITKTLFTLPALLATIESMLVRSHRYWLLIPVIVSVGLLGGYAQTLLYALSAAAAYLLVGVTVKRRLLGSRGTARLLLLAALGVALGFGLAAVRVAPTLAVTAMTTRAGGMDFQRAAVDSIEPWALVAGELLPAVFELPGWGAVRPDYVGATTLLLAALALAAWRSLGRVGWFHAGLAATATILSLGEYTPLYNLFLQLPFFSYFRGASRFSPIGALGIAVLAGYALDRRLVERLSAERKWRRAAIALAVGAVLIGTLSFVLSAALQWGRDPISELLREVATEDGWILLSAFRLRVGVALFCLVAGPVLLAACVRHWISHRTLEWLSVGLTATALFLLGWIQNPWLPPSALYDPPALTKALKQETDLFRVFSWAPRFSTYNVGVFYRDVVGRPPSMEFEEHYLRQFIPPNLGMLFGISTAEWYDALQTRRQALIANYMGSERAEPVRYSDGDFVDWKTRTMSLHDRLNLLAALNVKYLTHAFEIEDPRLEKVETLEVQIYPELPAVARVHLYRLNTAMPRAFVVPRSTAIQGEKQVLEALLAGTPDLRQEVILEEEVSPPQPPVL
ncbi:MAG: hypothetical protein ACYC5J_10105, partial [Chloroflexota bacterium]